MRETELLSALEREQYDIQALIAERDALESSARDLLRRINSNSLCLDGRKQFRERGRPKDPEPEPLREPGSCDWASRLLTYVRRDSTEQREAWARARKRKGIY